MRLNSATIHPNACRCDECDCPVVGVPLGHRLCMSCAVDDHCANLRTSNWRIDFDAMARGTYAWIVQRQNIRNGPWHAFDSAKTYAGASVIIACIREQDERSGGPVVLTTAAQNAVRFGYRDAP